MALTLLGTVALRAEHPAGAATAMLVSVGALRTGHDALLLMAGVLLPFWERDYGNCASACLPSTRFEHRLSSVNVPVEGADS